jgi:ADP-ribose pyrophosphatase YjhB (NUDIX family)
VLLVHRPQHDDWSLPKGKADPGESDEACALREVREETGMSCELGPYLGEFSYVDKQDRPKVARFWAMRPVEGEFRPTKEVDEVKWLPMPDAGEGATRSQDTEMIDLRARRCPDRVTILLVRLARIAHAQAVRRPLAPHRLRDVRQLVDQELPPCRRVRRERPRRSRGVV